MVTETPARGASDRPGGAPPVRGLRALLLGATCTLVSGCATPYLLQAASKKFRHCRDFLERAIQ